LLVCVFVCVCVYVYVYLLMWARAVTKVTLVVPMLMASIDCPMPLQQFPTRWFTGAVKHACMAVDFSYPPERAPLAYLLLLLLLLPLQCYLGVTNHDGQPLTTVNEVSK